MRQVIVLALLILIGVNLYFRFFVSGPLLQAKIYASSPSLGDRYYGTLQLWYLSAQSGDWDTADKLATRLNPVDLEFYRSHHAPAKLKIIQNQLTLKPDKTVEDWLELARVQLNLNKVSAAINSLSTAHLLDPIRNDIEKMYFELKN
ncbi:hypothetical protein A3K55_02535 [Candidatus Shapirobacteria bacterium RBG_13_44_7]|uniref:Uncharacterized protein n=1 Tax=Candidatus Shapirobacteria bacterium RBG_13_44_7 TaxID=1802149 RepID=A0A1F7SLI9_9BACT|nr:MAG: hypothetical protein A3K55_02535 [Candidatus Shapirobacteria bacterium RBG_13_44_7]